MDSAINLLPPLVRDTVISPSRLRAQRWLLQHHQIAAVPPAAMAVARPRIIPGDQINTGKDISNTEVVALAESERVRPEHQVTARPHPPRYFSTALIKVAVAHLRQCAASFLPG